MDRQERYVELYNTVELEMKKRGYLKETLMELCSVELDRKGNENLINFQFLLEPSSSLDTKTELKKIFDKYAKQYGFVVDYVNLTGDLY